MRSSNNQMELLSEVRTPQQALNYAVNRERGQDNQQEIAKANTSWNTVPYVRQNKPRTQMTNTQQNSTACWKFGNPFWIAHLKTCPAKTTQCKIGKKVEHYTSLSTAKMSERLPPCGPQNNSSPNYKQQQTRRVNYIKQEMPKCKQTEESIDAEVALYVKELHEDWANITLISLTEFTTKKNETVNKEPNG